MHSNRALNGMLTVGFIFGLPIGFAFSLFPAPAWMAAAQFHVIRVVGTAFAFGVFVGIVIGAVLAWIAGAGDQQHHHFHAASNNRPPYKGL